MLLHIQIWRNNRIMGKNKIIIFCQSLYISGVSNHKNKVKHKKQSRPVVMFCFVESMVWIHEFKSGTVDPWRSLRCDMACSHWPKRSRRASVRKKEKTKTSNATIGQVEFVLQWNGWDLDHTATPFCCDLHTEGQQKNLQWRVCVLLLHTRGGWVLPRQKLGCCQRGLQTSVRNGNH